MDVSLQNNPATVLQLMLLATELTCSSFSHFCWQLSIV